MENSSILFKIIYCILLSIYSLIRIIYAKGSTKIRNKKSKNDTYERIKVFIAFVGMVLIPLISVFTSFLNIFRIELPLIIIYFSIIGKILNVYFFYIIHKQLGVNWSPVLEIKKNQKLIKDGVYKYIRHPMYTQHWLWIILQGILLDNYFVEIFGIITFGILYFTRINKEEELMIEEFGEEYKKYMENTGRLLPKLNGLFKKKIRKRMDNNFC